MYCPKCGRIGYKIRNIRNWYRCDYGHQWDVTKHATVPYKDK